MVKISGENFAGVDVDDYKNPVTDHSMRIRVGDHERAERSNSPLVAHERERVSARSYARNARLARNNARFRSARCQP